MSARPITKWVAEAEVAGDQNPLLVERSRPDLIVRLTAKADIPHVRGRQTGVGESAGEGSRKILVDEEAERSHP